MLLNAERITRSSSRRLNQVMCRGLHFNYTSADYGFSQVHPSATNESEEPGKILSATNNKGCFSPSTHVKLEKYLVKAWFQMFINKQTDAFLPRFSRFRQ